MLIFFSWILFPGISISQETLVGDEGIIYPASPLFRHSFQSSQSLKTHSSISLPFLDDFSSENFLINPTIWETDTNRTPGISLSKSINPPSKGIATFDGATLNGNYYAAAISYGVADTLCSKPIDLGSLSPASNLWLSFFVQPGGRGDKPEYNDSLVLYFDTTGSWNFTQVWSVPGDSLSNDAFTRVMIQLDKAVYFHSNFRFKFVAFGSLNGELDQWHLDYVYLNQGRNSNDTVRNDISLINFDKGILTDFTSMPPGQLSASAWMDTFSAQVSNLNNTTPAPNLKISISDPVGGNIFTGTTVQTINSPLFPYSNTLLNVPAFSDQVVGNNSAILFTAWVNDGGSDVLSSNDTIRIQYAIDSLLAYDDGVADIGYGLTSARSFCQRYDLVTPDTLTAVWIHFVPSVYYNAGTGQSIPLEGKSFRLSVWKELHPDSFVVQQLSGMNVDYGDSPNEFIQYRLFNPLPLDSIFYVGIEQADAIPIGIGFDKNFVNDSKIFYESVPGPFIATNQQGTLMIRPEFGNPLVVSNEESMPSNNMQVEIFPNPATEGMISIKISGPDKFESIKYSLFDAQAKVMNGGLIPVEEDLFRIELGNTYQAGMYFIRIEGNIIGGENFSCIKKLIIK